MDRTDRPADDRVDGDEPASSTGDDGSTGGDRSALHVASEGESWRFSLDDLDEEGGPTDSLTPGSPDLEHVAFVLLGAAVTVFVFSRFLV